MSRADTLSFRERLRSKTPLIGTFVKVPTSHTTEILGGLGFDFVVIDEEHGPIGRDSTDRILLACQATGTAGIVRIPQISSSSILGVLDMGAQGVLVPHVDSVDKATEMVAACRYKGGNRGFSNTTRAGGYGGGSFAAHIAQQDCSVAAIAMIEDPAAVANIDAILATPGLDAIFIGRGDLAIALGETSMTAPVVEAAVEHILTSARDRQLPVMVTAGTQSEILSFNARGATGFIVSSDQGFLRQSALSAVNVFREWANTQDKG